MIDWVFSRAVWCMVISVLCLDGARSAKTSMRIVSHNIWWSTICVFLSLYLLLFTFMKSYFIVLQLLSFQDCMCCCSSPVSIWHIPPSLPIEKMENLHFSFLAWKWAIFNWVFPLKQWRSNPFYQTFLTLFNLVICILNFIKIV